MIRALQRLPKAEEQALIEVAVEHGLDRNDLACHMTRQQGHGRGKGPEGSFTPTFSISYNLMLCEYCGNLEPSRVCPAKVLRIKERLLNSQTITQTAVLAKRAVTCWICGGDGPLTCQCHNTPKGKKPYPCNMVCNA